MIQSVQRAAALLRGLAGAGPLLGVTELAERVDIAKPTAHALLRTLEAEQLVVQDRDTGRYRLGPELVLLGNAYLGGLSLRIHAVTWADQLARQAGEAVWAGILTGRRVLVVHHAFRPEAAVQIPEVGASVPWNGCALGKAMAAQLPEEERKVLLDGPLDRLTGATLVEPAALRAELEQVRAQGYAVEDGEAMLGDAGIAAAVLDRTGAVAGAVGLVGPVERLLEPTVRVEFAVRVRETARNLSHELGARRSPHP